jgi:hypothetical protein
MYAKIKNTTLIQYPYGFAQLQADNPYTNYGDNQDVAYWFPQTTSAIDNGYTLAEVITAPQPAYNPAHQKCTINDNPTLIKSVWTLEWTVTDFTLQEQADYYANLAEENKQKAENILSATDWTSIPAVADPIRSNPYLTNQGEFDTYRSAIRDIVLNPTFDAVFPIEPVEIWSN